MSVGSVGPGRARGSILALLLVAAATFARPSTALAEQGEEVSEEAEPPPLPPRREVPDLDGRPPSDANDVADAFLWIPRILTGPLYLITEYVIRVPLGAALYELERAGLLDWLFATGGPVTILPTVFVEFGLSPSVGIYAAIDGFPFDENRLSVHAATWGEDWLRLIVRDRIRLREGMDLAFRFEAIRRPDQLLEGFGHDATQLPRARFGMEDMEARVELHYRFWRRSELRYDAGYRTVGFYDTNWGGDPSVSERGPIPPGYPEGYELVFARADVLVDTHSPERELTRARFRLDLLAELNGAFGGLTENDPRQLVSSWVRWGGEIAGSTDFLGRGRTLMLRLRTQLVSPLGSDTVIPFYEYPDAGGSRGPLQGFVTGQLRGQSVVGLTFEYVWPVYALLDGTISASVGNAFGHHFEGFEWDRLRLGFQIGLLPRFSGEHLVEISLGFGTETFERGTEVTQVRLVAGTRHGL